MRHAAVILAGGNARRMGGLPKPELMLGGRTLLRRVLDAVPDATPAVVVGDVISRGFLVTIEEKPGSGPVPAAAAGLVHVPQTVPLVFVLASDMPFLNPQVTAALLAAVTPKVEGALLIDHSGRRQWLCGVWKQEALRARLEAAEARQGFRSILSDLAISEVSWTESVLPPWFDCDTPGTLEYARQLERQFPQG